MQGSAQDAGLGPRAKRTKLDPDSPSGSRKLTEAERRRIRRFAAPPTAFGNFALPASALQQALAWLWHFVWTVLI